MKFQIISIIILLYIKIYYKIVFLIIFLCFLLVKENKKLFLLHIFNLCHIIIYFNIN